MFQFRRKIAFQVDFDVNAALEVFAVVQKFNGSRSQGVALIFSHIEALVYKGANNVDQQCCHDDNDQKGPIVKAFDEIAWFRHITFSRISQRLKQQKETRRSLKESRQCSLCRSTLSGWRHNGRSSQNTV